MMSLEIMSIGYYNINSLFLSALLFLIFLHDFLRASASRPDFT